MSIPRKRGMAPAENLLVRIHSGDGASGVGACQYESRYGETAAEAALVIQKHYTPLLLKENPLNIETIMAKLDSFMPEHLASKAAIDIALHDLKGKMLTFRFTNCSAVAPATKCSCWHRRSGAVNPLNKQKRRHVWSATDSKH